jgi:hypothetical protein
MLALVFGALRISMALLRGRRISFDDLHILAFSVGGFIVAGSMVGVAWPLTRTSLGRYSVGVLGAAMMLGVFITGIDGSPLHWDHGYRFTWLLCTLIFGVAFGRSFRADHVPTV